MFLKMGGLASNLFDVVIESTLWQRCHLNNANKHYQVNC